MTTAIEGQAQATDGIADRAGPVGSSHLHSWALGGALNIVNVSAAVIFQRAQLLNVTRERVGELLVSLRLGGRLPGRTL
ncbi:hypothetical protein ACQEVZ_58610 [Dactylosporangium sp. CA-152071]|uniref:hypothetical protein n=1 Tax=Dactylosporangium sp. CA-152071 TaxID=3239933 RepID=UPI003D8A4363